MNIYNVEVLMILYTAFNYIKVILKIMCLRSYIFQVTESVGFVEFTDCRGVRPTNKRLGYDAKKSDGKTREMQELRRMQRFHSFPSLLGPLGLGVVAPDRVSSWCNG